MKRMFLIAGLAVIFCLGSTDSTYAQANTMGRTGWFGFGFLGGHTLTNRIIGAPGIMPSHLGHEPLYDWTPYITGQYGYSPGQPYIASAFYQPGAYTWAYPVYPTWHGGLNALPRRAARFTQSDGTIIEYQE